MRILHVNKYLYRRGGAEAYMLDLASLQAARGDDVALFGMRHPQNERSPYDRHFPSYVELDPPPDSMRQRVQIMARMFWSTSSRAGMQSMLEEFQPDVVHLHNIYHQLSPSILAPLRGTPTRVVMTLHDYKLVCPSYRMLDHGRPCDACITGGLREAVRRRCKDGSLSASTLLAAETWFHRAIRAYDRVDVLISPSRFLAATMMRGGVAGQRLQVVPHPVVTDGVSIKRDPGGDLIYAGRLSDEKGIDVLIRAVSMVPRVRLRVAGEGPADDALRSLSGQIAPGRVEFLGRLHKAALFDTIRASSAVVVPSRWYENQPIAVLEAFACGLPVVATDLGGLPELVATGVDGLVVAPDDPHALAQAIDDIASDPTRALGMGHAGRAKVERWFSPDRHLRALDGIYRPLSSTVRMTVRGAAG